MCAKKIFEESDKIIHRKLGRYFFLVYFYPINNKKQSGMKNVGRKVYMTLSGVCFTPEYAAQLYGAALENAPLCKAVVNKDGDVIGTWE